MLTEVKKHLTPKQIRDDIVFFALLNLGLAATAAGIALFKTPNHFAFGGTSGLSIVLATLFPRFNVGAFMWAVNAVLVVLGFIFLGIRSMGWTIYSSFALSFYVSAFEWAVPLREPLTNDVFLELCYAVILSAVGAAIVFNIGASTGGTDIVAMILNKYTSMPVGRALMVSDLGIVLAGAYLYGPATGLYCILGMILKSTVADSAIEGINLRKVCTVVTSRPEPVRDFIVNELHRSATMEQAQALLLPAVEQLKQHFGPLVYGVDVASMEEVVFAKLKEKGLTLGTAESCTGGLVAKRFTDLPGSSQVFKGGIVAYTNEIKEKLLGVSPAVLAEKSAVSPEVALAMAEGARKLLSCDIALATTGVAGPEKDDRGHEIGTMFVAIATPEGSHVRPLTLGNRPMRQRQRTNTAHNAFDLARRYLTGLPYENH